jgi:PAS domain S-box-containing protein
MTRSVGLRIGLGIVLAATLLALLIGVTYRNTRQLVAAARWVEHTHDTINESDSLLTDLKENEHQARGYILTGRPEYLALYRASLGAIAAAIDRLHRSTADNPGQQARLTELRVLIAEEQQLTAQAIALRDRDGLEASAGSPMTAAADVKIAQIRDLVGAMQTEERRLLRTRTAHTTETARAAILTLSIGAILLLLFLALIWALVRFDLVKRHEAETKLRASVAKLDTTLRSIGDAVLATDARGLVTLMNPVAEALTGWKEREAAGREVREVFRIVQESSRAEVESPVVRVLREGLVVGLANHTVLVARDGTERPIADSGAPIRDESGNVSGVVLVFRDISEKRAAERDIHRLAAIVSSSEDAIIGETLDGTITAWNAAAERLFGYSAEEAIGRSIGILEPPTLAESSGSHMRRIAKGEHISRYDTTRTRKDGQRVSVSISVSPIRDADGKVVGASKIARDIGERKRAETLLRASEQRFRSLSDSVSSLVWIADAQGEASYLNRRWYDYTGLSEAESLKKGWTKVVHPEDFPAAREKWRRAIETGEPYESELRYRAADGSYRWFMARAERVQSPSGPIWIGNSTDVDALKASAAEIEKARKAAEQANTAKDRFLAVLSHELRTPLTPVLVSAQLLEKRLDVSEEVQRTIALMRRNIELEALLVDDLLDLTRISRGKIELRREAIDLDTAIQNVTEICRSEMLAKRQSLRVELLAREHYADADPARIQQVFWNLVKNASKFTPEGGTITVRSENPMPQVFRVSVSDTGIGIAPDLLPRIFDAFQQGPVAPSAQAGLGLGLSISKALVELHGGTIRAESAGTDRGSTFVVELAALSERRGAPRSERSERRSARQRPLRILVVEDHADTAAALAQLLRTENHEVEIAQNITEAVRAVELREFDLFITDLGLPDGNGHDLMARLRAIRPIQGIVLSGYGMEADIARSAAAGFAEHLIKPINVTQLLNTIRRLGHQIRRARERFSSPVPADAE